MSKTIIISVTADQKLELPSEIQATLKPGDEYAVWQTEDTILIKKIQKPQGFSDLWQRIDDLGHDTEQPAVEEIAEIVKEVRRTMAEDESRS
ncbi:hypothetical protein [Leptolyngbya sp. FACHB-711]|uniref:hypothetical protein n=1 Tax=unclassified Leptolyngbya TaxID=2650499 RepID=UPI0016897473|nr:hypothetical protein [Leptolyngbya sp. FACHB-711]MBD1852310.1 hypothetical protein [Cyanobacteria bacterium FACHB-502]MBD2024501.1 hypothetical protein [Leptolyngbya sp. FACHB-711]